MDSIVLNNLTALPVLVEKLLPVVLLWFTCAKIIWPNILKVYYLLRRTPYWVFDEHWDHGKFWNRGSDWIIGFVLLIALAYVPSGEFFIYLTYVFAAFFVVISAFIGDSIHFSNARKQMAKEKELQVPNNRERYSDKVLDRNTQPNAEHEYSNSADSKQIDASRVATVYEDQFAYSPDDSMIAAVWVQKGQKITPVIHRQLLADRLQCLLDMCDDPVEIQKLVEQEHLEPAGLYVGDGDVGLAAYRWMEQIETTGALNSAGAVVSERVQVENDNLDARRYLENEKDDPEESLLNWIGQVTYYLGAT